MRSLFCLRSGASSQQGLAIDWQKWFAVLLSKYKSVNKMFFCVEIINAWIRSGGGACLDMLTCQWNECTSKWIETLFYHFRCLHNFFFLFARISAAPNPHFKTMANDCEAWLNANPLGKLSLPVYSVWTFYAEVTQWLLAILTFSDFSVFCNHWSWFVFCWPYILYSQE